MVDIHELPNILSADKLEDLVDFVGTKEEVIAFLKGKCSTLDDFRNAEKDKIYLDKFRDFGELDTLLSSGLNSIHLLSTMGMVNKKLFKSFTIQVFIVAFRGTATECVEYVKSLNIKRFGWMYEPEDDQIHTFATIPLIEMMLQKRRIVDIQLESLMGGKFNFQRMIYLQRV